VSFAAGGLDHAFNSVRFGLPLAYWLATSRVGAGSSLIEAVVALTSGGCPPTVLWVFLRPFLPWGAAQPASAGATHGPDGKCPSPLHLPPACWWLPVLYRPAFAVRPVRGGLRWGWTGGWSKASVVPGAVSRLGHLLPYHRAAWPGPASLRG